MKPLMLFDSSLKIGELFDEQLFVGSGVAAILPASDREKFKAEIKRPRVVCHPDTWVAMTDDEKSEFELVP